MKLTKPLIANFVQGSGQVTVDANTITIPQFAKWDEFKQAVTTEIGSDKYDYMVLSFNNAGNMTPDNIKSLDIKANTILRSAKDNGLRVFNRYEGQMYFLNPSFDEERADSKGYAPSDDVVLAKRDLYPDDYDWQKHQADIIKKLAVTMPLTEGKGFEKSNHKSMLTSASRGLEEKDLKDFFSWKSNKVIIPALVGDDMVGMPSVKASIYNDMELYVGNTKVPTAPINIKTIGLSGAMIPMKNPRGDSPKYQIATDISPINVILKGRAADGISVQKSEFYDKKASKNGEYKFTINGEPSHLTVESTSGDVVTFSDTKGSFDADMKQDIKPFLVDRGYEIPDIIDTLKPTANSKYIWMSRGTMVGSDKINNNKVEGANRISPSIAGFQTAREPKNGSEDYVVVVAEGALKGVITAKYLNVPDKNGKSVGDFIAKDKGIIVAQVPGVAASFVKSVDRIYSEKHVVGTYIALDADGRENKAVATGIHGAFNELSKNGPVKVMSWDPAQKGIDDALIAVAKHKITVEDMDIHFGSPEKLFPLDKATAPNPYKLDGSRANKEAWKEEYDVTRKEQEAKIKALQNDSIGADVKKSDEITLDLDGLDVPQEGLSK